MRKFMITLLAIATLGAGSAFAQSGMWAGLSTGYPFGVTLHFGLEDIGTPGLDVRANVGFGLVNGSVSDSGVTVSYSGNAFSVGADALYNLDLGLDANVNTYVGGGLGIGFGSVTSASSGGTTVDLSAANLGLFTWELHALFGAEYMVTSEIGVFAELQLGYGSNTVSGTFTAQGFTFTDSYSHGQFKPALRIGGNYHF